MNRILNQTSGSTDYTSEISSLNALKHVLNINITLDTRVWLEADSMWDIDGALYVQDARCNIGAWTNTSIYVVASSTLVTIISPVSITWSEVKRGWFDSTSRRVLAIISALGEVTVLDSKNYLDASIQHSRISPKVYEGDLLSYYLKSGRYSNSAPRIINPGLSGEQSVNFKQIIKVGNNYVATGDTTGTTAALSTPVAAWSLDGDIWNIVSLPGAVQRTNAYGPYIASTLSGGVAVIVSGYSTNGQAWRSTNYGVSWSAITVGYDAAYTSDFVFENNYFIVSCFTVGNGTTCVRYSSDGLSWSSSAYIGNYYSPFGSMGYGNGRYVYACGGGYIGYSASLSTAFTQAQPYVTGARNYNVVKYLNGSWVALGTSVSTATTRLLSTSADGISWTTQSTSNIPVDYAVTYSNMSFTDITYYDGLYYLVGNPAGLWTTSNLTSNTWTRIYILDTMTNQADTICGTIGKISIINGKIYIGAHGKNGLVSNVHWTGYFGPRQGQQMKSITSF